MYKAEEIPMREFVDTATSVLQFANIRCLMTDLVFNRLTSPYSKRSILFVAIY